MDARRMRSGWGFASPLAICAVSLALLGSFPARAGVFDDEEARRQIKDLSIQTAERIDTLSKAQFELVNQIQALREEAARLRGQLETLNYELDSAKKRQQDFYIDLDGRLRKLETQTPPAAPPAADAPPANGETKPPAPEVPKKPAVDPALETRDYEAALNLFKANKIKEAASAFDAFVKTYPESTLAPNASYWLGNAYYSLRDCKKAIEVQKGVFSKWPQHPKAPDALITLATCQQELGDAKGARTSFETIVSKYPDSPAAATAKQRLKK